ncbi:MAG: AAA-like domain-containing protein, partial [Saprospiraceae bacterium]|nr:AAA-like domain-containing protein [Saprospiraceae bacterium]
MEKHFNTAGPNNPDWHYTIDPLHRWDLDTVMTLIRQNKYFVLHAPRQTGKTSCLLALCDYLNQTGRYKALYANIETAQAAREDTLAGIRTVMGSISSNLKSFLHDNLLYNCWNDILQQFGPEQALAELLKLWAQHEPLPIVLLLDEVDALIGDTLISLLRQIRAGYAVRPAHFPASVVLCGVRDVWDVGDYRIHSAHSREIITGGSAFNIKAESLRLGDFSKEDIQNLYTQHTQTTGQTFGDDSWDLVYDYTGGQPWLVNALAYEACFRMKEGKDRSTP